MNIAVSRAYGALRVVGASREMEKDPILSRGMESVRPTAFNPSSAEKTLKNLENKISNSF